MKRYFLPALVLACLFPFPGRARSDDFADFRIPTHQVLSWTGSLDGWWRGSTNDLATIRGRSGYLSGATGSDFNRFTDGETGFTDLFLSANFGGTRSNFRDSRYEQLPSLTRSSNQRSSLRSTSEREEVGYSFGRYLGRAPIELGADARALNDQTQGWNNWRTVSSETDPFSTTDYWSESDTRSRQANTVVSLRPRVGLGRVRDATGVYTARVIEERLRGDGVLTRPLSHEARQKLVDLLTLRYSYDVLHVRPGKGLWAEIERIVGDDGALAPGGLDASSTQHAGESLLEAVGGRSADGLPGTIVFRLRGARAGAFLSGVHQRGTSFEERSDQSQFTFDGVPQPIFSSRFSQSSAASSDAVDAGLQAEWHRPVGLRVQLDASADTSVPLRPQDTGLNVAMNGQASWMIADRWLVRGFVGQRRNIRQNAEDGTTREDTWAFTLVGQASYEVEDHVTIQLRVDDTQNGARQPAAGLPGSRTYRRGQSVTLGLSYRFAGRFSAPGFENLSRKMPPTPGF